MATEAFIEVNRKGGGKALILATAITAFIEVDPKENSRDKPVVQIHVGTSTFVTVQDEPLGLLWNKYLQAFGYTVPRISTVDPAIPGYPHRTGPVRIEADLEAAE